MTINKRSKLSRYRGSHTHGGGSKKKRRGAGNRGGRGKAGSGKKADQKANQYKKNEYFGKKGFNSKSKKQKPITLTKLNVLAKEAKLINLTELGYDKLLGSGNISKPIKVQVAKATTKAITKIEFLKGSITLK